MTTHCLSGRDLSRCGVQDGFRTEGRGLSVIPGRNSAVFVSQVYDSGREGTEWNHIRLDIGADAVLEAYVWLFDQIDEEDEASLREDAGSWLEGHQKEAQYVSNYRNMLLYGKGCGRYARLAVKVFQGEGAYAAFGGYDLSFPKESFTEYLPAIFRDNLQLERFLAVHQNIYLGLEEDIETLAEKMDYELCSNKQAVRLAQWLGWGDLAWQVDKDTLRKLLRTGTSLACRKGTCAYYTEMTKILTGEDAVMMEEPEKCRAAVLIWNRPKNGRERHLEWLKKNAPIGIELEFVILDGTGSLDAQFYLDRTSRLLKHESGLPPEGVPIECMKLL